MRSKTPLALMEQLVMVLVFALSAAFCLRVFVAADRLSREQEALSYAVAAAQNTAELLKISGEDWEQQLADGQWKKAEGVWRTECETASGGVLEIWPQEQTVAGLAQAEIRVIRDDGELLFAIPVAWQKEGSYE